VPYKVPDVFVVFADYGLINSEHVKIGYNIKIS